MRNPHKLPPRAIFWLSRGYFYTFLPPEFAEKVSLNPLYFIGGALLVLAIVLGVVVLNCLRIARANPVESLKNE